MILRPFLGFTPTDHGSYSSDYFGSCGHSAGQRRGRLVELRHHRHGSPMQTLQDRFALGEIGREEFEHRNPLRSIEGTMEALLDGVVEADDDTYSRVGREAARLRRLADDLSTLSAAGESSLLNLEAVDVAASVAVAVTASTGSVRIEVTDTTV